MRFTARYLVLLAALAGGIAPFASGQLPRVVAGPDGGQIIVRGKPFLILGGELGNSSAGTAAQADTILPRLAKLHVNTVLMPVAWSRLSRPKGPSISAYWIIGSM